MIHSPLPLQSLGLWNTPQGAVLGCLQYDSLPQQQMANWNAQQALMPPQQLIDRQMYADLAFKAKRVSQNWLNAMLDVELGLC